MNDKTVFCDKCGANSNNVLVLVTRKKVRCYPCLTMAGIQDIFREINQEQFNPEQSQGDLT